MRLKSSVTPLFVEQSVQANNKTTSAMREMYLYHVIIMQQYDFMNVMFMLAYHHETLCIPQNGRIARPTNQY